MKKWLKTIAVFYLLFNISAQAQVLVQDIGVMGLASHDMFSWDRKTESNKENGRLDLSTIFDYDEGQRWRKGGDPKNSENAPVWSITKRLVQFYEIALQNTGDSTSARQHTVQLFHRLVKSSFTRLAGRDFPVEAFHRPVNHLEQAAMRALHDILPGRVPLHRPPLFPLKSIRLTDFKFRKFYLNRRELNQEVKFFDGQYDPEYREIHIPFPLPKGTKIDLQEVDRQFIEKFSPYKHHDMLAELKDVGLGTKPLAEVSFIHHIYELFQKGLCDTDNPWMKTGIPCFD